LGIVCPVNASMSHNLIFFLHEYKVFLNFQWKKLFTDTISGNKNYIIDTVSENKNYIIDTVYLVSANKSYITDTVSANKN
jgi:hypothetical protein